MMTKEKTDSFGHDVGVVTSKYYMVRCLISMAHADGVFHNQERIYLEKLLQKIPFSDEQKDVLISDFDKPQTIEQLMPFICEPSYRSQLGYFALILAYKDGELHPSEKEILDKIDMRSLNGQDVDELKLYAKTLAEHEMDLHKIEINNLRPQKNGKNISWFQILDELFDLEEK